MHAYKHYSFDLWLTLIKSNPSYKKQRSRYFFDHYNQANKPLAEVEAVFRQVDLMCNAINEKTGKNIDADELCLMVISLMNDNQFPLHEVDINALCAEMDQLVFEHLPVLYSDNTASTLAYIKDDLGSSVSLLSNTGFIKGETLRQVLKELDIDQYIDFQLYSDEAGMSKPNPDFFKLMIDRVFELKNVQLTDIIHIGDNPKADVDGANAVGINSLLINSNHLSITNLIPNATQHLFSA